jgi:hypothetical protein
MKLCPVILLSVIVTANAADLPQTPNSTLTPGAINTLATKAILCVPNYTSGKDAQGSKVRDVNQSLKTRVFAEYNIDPTSSKFEIDHLVSLELGGSNDIRNLWPQSYITAPYNAHMKDYLENKLHKMVCAGQIELLEAQKEISTDWISAYNKYVTK